MVEEFLKEKKAGIEDDKPKTIDLRLPGDNEIICIYYLSISHDSTCL